MQSVEAKNLSLDNKQELYESTNCELNGLVNEVMKDEELDKALRRHGLQGIKDVMGAEFFKGSKSLPGENLYEKYKDFDFSKIAKNGKFLPGVEKEDAFGKYIEIEGRKFYDSMAVALSDSEEPMFTYHISNAGLQLGNQIGTFNLGKGIYYSFYDGNKTDYTFQYKAEDIKNAKSYPAIIRYLKKLEGK